MKDNHGKWGYYNGEKVASILDITVDILDCGGVISFIQFDPDPFLSGDFDFDYSPSIPKFDVIITEGSIDTLIEGVDLEIDIHEMLKGEKYNYEADCIKRRSNTFDNSWTVIAGG